MTWKTCVLVVANQTADSDELISRLRARSERGPTQFTLLLPGLPGTSSEGSKERLALVLERMQAAGVEADGVVGDSNPLTAVRETWDPGKYDRSEEHTSELQSQSNLVCRLLLEKK